MVVLFVVVAAVFFLANAAEIVAVWLLLIAQLRLLCKRMRARPKAEGLALSPQFENLLLSAERSTLEFDLNLSAVHVDVACFCERDVILDPGLSVVFSDELLENLALVVFALSDQCVKHCDRAQVDDLASGQQVELVARVRLEAERLTSAAARAVKLHDLSAGFSIYEHRKHAPLEAKAENIVVCRIARVIFLPKIELFHFRISFLIS